MSVKFERTETPAGALKNVRSPLLVLPQVDPVHHALSVPLKNALVVLTPRVMVAISLVSKPPRLSHSFQLAPSYQRCQHASSTPLAHISIRPNAQLTALMGPGENVQPARTTGDDFDAHIERSPKGLPPAAPLRPFHHLCRHSRCSPRAKRSIRFGPQLTAEISLVNRPPMLLRPLLHCDPFQYRW